MKERRLGRGLSELLTENDLNLSTEEVVKEISVDEIKINPEQPRTYFDEEAINDLAQSIKEHGVIQPIIVKPSNQGFVLVAGERRLRACKVNNLRTIPAIVREYNSIYLAELALLENLQREDLTAIEEAIALKKLQTNSNLTHEQLGKKVGKSRVYVTNLLGLLKLPQVVIEDVIEGRISAGHARALSKIKDEKTIMMLRDRVVSEELNVRELEVLIRGYNNKDTVKISKNLIANTNKDLKQHFDDQFKVKVNQNSVSFKFKDETELKRIIKYIKGMR